MGFPWACRYGRISNSPSSVLEVCQLYGGYIVFPCRQMRLTVLALSAPERLHRPQAALPLDSRQGQIVLRFGLGC
jgi:hypothetical protein